MEATNRDSGSEFAIHLTLVPKPVTFKTILLPYFNGESIMGVIMFILFGLVVGIIARFLMPGRQPMGFILTAILGIAGSFIGSFIGGLIQGQGETVETSDPYNWIGATLGALLLLFLYGMMAKRTSV
jgi:uncharacterized membrane protein YeaQ/YmgE (transglycosylase-associated protein family)